MTKDIAEKPGTDLATREAELAAQARSGIRSEDLILPLVKLLQQQSREVTHGDGESGTFLNSLTGESYGEEFEFVIAHTFIGRFYAPDKEERTYVAASAIAPENWPEEYAGKPFADIPDAEEQWKARANDPEDSHEWGEGPPIQTTRNFIGFEVGNPGVPIRLSLKATSTPAARKISSIQQFWPTPWASTVKLSAGARENKKKQPYYVVEAEQGEQTSPEIREAAMALAETAGQAQFQLTGDAPDEKPAKPEKPKGGLDVA